MLMRPMLLKVKICQAHGQVVMFGIYNSIQLDGAHYLWILRGIYVLVLMNFS